MARASPELRGRQGAAATHRAGSVAYAVTGAALTGWPGGTCGYRPISARSHRRVASPQPSTTLPTPCIQERARPHPQRSDGGMSGQGASGV